MYDVLLSIYKINLIKKYIMRYKSVALHSILLTIQVLTIEKLIRLFWLFFISSPLLRIDESYYFY